MLTLVKPVGSRCNLRCGYCYYLAKEKLFESPAHLMGLGVLEKFIQERLGLPGTEPVHFEWHGGEPTLAGLDFYRSAVRLQRQYGRGRKVTNALQTNGLKIDNAWADFLKKENFSVGLSLDGPADLHDGVRRTTRGEATHRLVLEAWHRLKAQGVFTNVLCVVTASHTREPDRVYEFFRALGVRYLQFLPYVPPLGVRSPLQAPPGEWGSFLCRVFDLWVQHDVGRIVVQSFDEALRPLVGLDHALCVHRETCGEVTVMEHEGSLFACDHFVDGAHRLGNLVATPLAELLGKDELYRFGQNKKDGLSPVCQNCQVLSFCHGGCPKDRDSAGLNRLCPDYRSFFSHVKKPLERLAAHIQAGRPQGEFRLPDK